MTDTSLILLNGGLGKRVGSKIPKQLLRLREIPVFLYTLRIVDEIPEISEVIINYPSEWEHQIRDLIKKYAIKTPITYCEAGHDRQSSVSNMLKKVNTSSVIIHEAARPLIDKSSIRKLIEDTADNISYTIPLPFTVLMKKKKSNYLSKLLSRDRLVNIQLPQKFSTSVLKNAHEKAKKNSDFFTEDASLVFSYGTNVKLIHGSERNIKITSALDLHIAEFLLTSDDMES